MQSKALIVPPQLLHKDIKIHSPEMMKWLLVHTKEWKGDHDTLHFFKGEFNLQLFFKSSQVRFNRFLKKYVKIYMSQNNFILMDKEQFENEIASKAKLFFSKGMNRIHGTDIMIDRFIHVMKKKFGTEAVTIEE